MTDNLTQYLSAGLDSIWVGHVDATGSFIGAAATLANAADSGGFVMLGPQSADLAIPELERVNVSGGDGRLATFLFESETETGFTFEAGAIDLDAAMASQGRAVETVNNWEIGFLRPAIRTPQTMWWVINSQAKSQTSGSLNNPGFQVILAKVEASYLGPSGISNKSAHNHRFQAVVNQADVYPWGAAPTGGAADAFPFWSAYRIRLHAMRGDNSDVTLTLPSTIAGTAADDVNIWKDGVLQTYTTDYTITDQVITWETAGKLDAGELGVVAYPYTP